MSMQTPKHLQKIKTAINKLQTMHILSEYELLRGIKSRNLANCSRCLKQGWPKYGSICLDIQCQINDQWVWTHHPRQTKLEIHDLELLDTQEILIQVLCLLGTFALTHAIYLTKFHVVQTDKKMSKTW